MSPDPASNIRVFIRWHDQTVFAGEEVKCRITFKNVAQSPNAASSSSAKSSPHSARQPTSDRSRQASALHGLNRNKPSSGLAPPAAARGHRSTLSLSVPSARTSRNRSDSIPWPPQNAHDANSSSNGGHRRSVSIVSIASASTTDGRPPSAGGPPKPYRPTRGHARASSLQIVPRAGPLPNGPRSASHPHRPFSSQPSPLLTASYPPDRHALYSNNTSGPSSSRLGSNRNSPRLGSQPVPDFKFPMSPASPADGRRDSLKPYDDSLISPSSSGGDLQHMPIRSRDQQVPTINEHNATPAARVLSTTSIAGTPRSSGEFYSVSNNSTETLASEYVLQQPHRAQGRSPHLRQRSNLSGQRTRPEALMMGYAQVHGSFTLDGSLIDLAPFEQVKRKAVVGGQGGGVIGVEPSARRDSGLLRSFGWSSFTSSIGELLGAGELSSIKEMRGIASSKSVPLLSTPQSILFVDLQLAPGESKTYEYSFKLPKGLPPTHKGKAMKIAYSLVIGTQRPGGAKEQQVKSVEVPFRVLGSVNSYGEILGHDLMSPYILLRDQAKIQSIDKSALVEDKTRKTAPSSESTVNGFLSYVDELLNQRDAGGMAGGLLSPTAMPSSRRPSAFEESTTAREAIDLAILRSNMTAEGQQSANRFEIARNGRRVGVVMLARPSYRVGETVTMAVDFSGAEVPCYAVHAALETAERVDPSLALRSEASVHRVTRKVYVSSSEATLFARRAVFSPTIPVSATPEFVTSGVSLEWKIRLEFVVPTNPERMVQNPGNEGEAEAEAEDEEYDGSGEQQHAGGGGGGGGGGSAAAAAAQSERKLLSPPSSGGSSQPHHLLEEISHDDRGGLVLVAAENLICESFEVAVPLRVYGAVTTGLERLERDEALEEGLVV